jgi:FemAB-related protein (PEP-CTERM system-associated)
MECTGTLAAPPEVHGTAIQAFGDSVAAEWDSYVLQCPSAGFFHLSGWKCALENTFRYSSYYFYAKRAGNITGVCPLFLTSNRITGKCLISVPFGAYGGIAADDEATAELLIHEAKRLAYSLEVEYLELRSRRSKLLPGFHPISRYATFTTELKPDHDVNLKHLPRDTRYMIRKGEKGGLAAHHGLEQMDVFYRLFAQNMHQHGTPVFPRKFFDSLVAAFERDIDLMLIYSGAQPIGGVLSFVFRDAVLPYYTGVSPLSRPLAGNNFMYWELMKWAVERGLRTFDFGRSKKGTGAYTFKTGWNMNPEPLDYQLCLVRRKSEPNFSPTNPRFELAARIWKKLPFSATLLIGPRVSPWFP